MNEVRQAFVFGSKNFAATVSALAAECGVEVLGCVDDFAPVEQTAGTFDALSREHAGGPIGLLLGVGYKDLAARWRVWERVQAAGWRTPILVHPRAHLAPGVEIGSGTLVMAGAVVDHRCRIGQACVLWPQACVNHDCVVEDNCFLSPQALLCGHVQLGAHSFLGAQSAVVDGALLPAGTRLKMGSLHVRRNA
ncbi:MAG: hypothetical protein J0L58_16645 [Burkholderiales bacterium]|nr:hypothetical protein [Burkholderiales bacterium]